MPDRIPVTELPLTTTGWDVPTGYVVRYGGPWPGAYAERLTDEQRARLSEGGRRGGLATARRNRAA